MPDANDYPLPEKAAQAVAYMERFGHTWNGTEWLPPQGNFN